MIKSCIPFPHLFPEFTIPALIRDKLLTPHVSNLLILSRKHAEIYLYHHFPILTVFLISHNKSKNMKVKSEHVKSFSHLQFFETLQTIPRQLLWPWNSPGTNTEVGCYASSTGDLPNPDGTHVSCIARRFFTIWATTDSALAFIKG